MDQGVRHLTDRAPQEVVVYSGASPCPYLPGQTARTPLRLPLRPLAPHEFDQRLAAGDRRSGMLLYRTQCPACRACEPLRVEVEHFQPNRSQRRAWARGEAAIDCEIGVPAPDAAKVDLYNRHKRDRGLTPFDTDADQEGYRDFLVDSCCHTIELRYRIGGKLAGVAIADRGEDSLSAVYCYFDPDHRGFGLGTYSVLKQIQLCRDWGLRWLYLGLYVAASPHLAYKALFLPHERLIDGHWRQFDRA